MADADLLVIMAPDLAARVADWRRSLADVRRVSPRTVEVHKARMMDKLGVNNVADLVRLNLELPS